MPDLDLDELDQALEERDQAIGRRLGELEQQLRAQRRPNYADDEAAGVDDGERPPLELAAFRDAPIALRSDESLLERALQREDAHELEGLTPGRFLRAAILGPKTPAERRALGGATAAGGGVTVPDALSASFIDLARAASVVARAGAAFVPLDSDQHTWARVASDPVPAWRDENAEIAESEPTFAATVFKPKSLAVEVKVSRELLADSLNIEQILPEVLSQALAQELDRVALLGTGVDPEPRGVANFQNLTANAFAGGALSSYAPFIQARTALRSVNHELGAVIMSPRDDGILAGLTASDGQPLQIPAALAQTPMLVTSKVPTDLGGGGDESLIIAGDFSRLAIGVRQALQIEVNPYVSAKNHQVSFFAHLRADIQPLHEAAFTVLSGVTES